MKKIIEWFKWRGITLKDFVYMTLATGLMISVTGIMIYALIVSMGAGQ